MCNHLTFGEYTMTFKAGQWVVVDTTAPYWPDYNKHKKGPFKISHIDVGGQGKYAVLEKAPNNAYFQHLTLYKPQVGDKVKILKPMNNFEEYPNILKNQTGKIGIITKIQELCGETNISIQCEDESHGWWYVDEENVYYELVEPSGSINAAVKAPDAVKPQPTKRVLNA